MSDLPVDPAPEADVPASPDIVFPVGDPTAHVHQWKSFGTDEGGSQTLKCDCGAEGVGYGAFETGVI